MHLNIFQERGAYATLALVSFLVPALGFATSEGLLRPPLLASPPPPPPPGIGAEIAPLAWRVVEWKYEPAPDIPPPTPPPLP